MAIVRMILAIGNFLALSSVPRVLAPLFKCPEFEVDADGVRGELCVLLRAIESTYIF